MDLIIAFKHELSEDFMTRKKQEIIQWWTKSKYYHVELIIGNIWLEADNTKGIVKHNLRPLSDKYDYVQISLPECEHTERIANNFILSQIGAGYDWVGIFLSQFIKLGIDKRDKWFCSEFIVKILQIYNFEPSIYVDPQDVSPKKLYDLVTKAGGGKLIGPYEISKINDIIATA